MNPFLLGLLASFFFSLTFILNRSMDLGGGYWVWSGVLRFAFMVPLLAVLVPFWGGWKPIAGAVKKAPLRWWLWSTVGFGLFYAPMCWAASFGEAWLVAGLWQVTIVCGVLLFPTRGTFPWKTLIFSALILAGVVLLQIGHTGSGSWWAAALVLVSAIAYPLGNRKIMKLAGGTLTAVQRVTAMTVLSLPFWAVLAIAALAEGKIPTAGQTVQTLAVALCSGVIATVLFFQATDRVRNDPVKLGAIEATQAGEVVFSVLGEALVFGTGWPGVWPTVGLTLIVVGMLIHSLHTRR